MRKEILVGYIFAAIILGITVGIIVHIYNDNTLEQATLKEVKIAEDYKSSEEKDKNKNVIQAGTTKEKSSPNSDIIFETYYNKCGHTEIKKETISIQDVNKEEDYFIDKYAEWTLKSFTSDEVNLYKEVNDMCKKHYVIRENNGYIAIYTIDAEDVETLKEVTDTLVKYLPQDDMELLKKGIRANGDSELAQKLSDFE